MSVPVSVFIQAAATVKDSDLKKAFKSIRNSFAQNEWNDLDYYKIDLDRINDDSVVDTDPIRFDEIDEDEQISLIENDGDIRIVPVMMPKQNFIDHLYMLGDLPELTIEGRVEVTRDELKLLDDEGNKNAGAKRELRRELSQAILDDYAGEENVEAVHSPVSSVACPKLDESGCIEGAFDPKEATFVHLDTIPGLTKQMMQVQEEERFTVVSENKIVGTYDTEEEATEASLKVIEDSFGHSDVSVLRSVEVATSKLPDKTVIDVEVSFAPRLPDDALSKGYFVYAKRKK